jgi:predicted alpha/beta-hydrolase family hydrolase
MLPQRLRLAVDDAIDVGALWLAPDTFDAVLTLAHGAGAGMEHATMTAIAEALARQGIATLRFNFPFREQGRPRVDDRSLACRTIAAAADHAARLAPQTPLFLSGHSFGGRMSSHAILDVALPPIAGAIFYAFPLHPAGRPSTARAAHLTAIDLPMLFQSGTRDALAERNLLEGVVRGLGDRAQLHWLDTADHRYKVLKRLRGSSLPVFEEMAAATARFVRAGSGTCQARA